MASLFPERYSPFNVITGSGNQNAYLAEISEELFETVLASVAVDYGALQTGGSNRLTFEAVKEQLEDAVQRALEVDPALNKTTKETLIQARRGQGKFRKNVEAIEKACRLTGITNPTLLIASLIKPWRVCATAQECLDGMNGLLLSPDADRLFDRGFITFEDEGRVKISPRVEDDDLRRLGFETLVWMRSGVKEAQSSWKSFGLRQDQRTYMQYHRSEVFVA